MEKVTATERRKEQHIHINLEQNVQFPNVTTGLENYTFMHQALPELNLSEIDTSLTFLGKKLNTPLFISSMTGGTPLAQKINLHLAEAAQEQGMAMGLGSQRAAIEDEALEATYQVRRVAPDILLFANVGAVQFNYGYDVEHCRQAVDMVEADALILHFNVLQEATQPEGDTNFAGLLKKVEEVCVKVGVPVIAKEVGWGISEKAAAQLAEAGVSVIDVAGAGGTSWSEVEYHRAPSTFHARIARSFADWGIPTTDSIQYARKGAPGLPILASGGLHDGIDIAKCIALGANMGGMAGALLKAATDSTEAVIELEREITTQLKIAMLCAGAANLDDLAQTPLYQH